MTNRTNKVATKFLSLYKFLPGAGNGTTAGAFSQQVSICSVSFARPSSLFTQPETIPANMKRKAEFGISELTEYFNQVGNQYIMVTVSFV